MKKAIAMILCLAVLTGLCAFAETNDRPQPDRPPEGMNGQPPARPDGEPPEGMNGEPPAKPDGEMPGMPGGPGGMAQAPAEYASVTHYDADAEATGETFASEGADENAVLVTAGEVALTDCTITRACDTDTDGDAASFYGVGAALLATGGTLSAGNVTIDTDVNGGAGAFAYGEGSVRITDSVIETRGNAAGGVHVAGGGTLYAENLVVTTWGESSAAIRSDRGGGQMTVNGGSYTSHGVGSPAVYVTADIDISNATLAATGSEALCLEGKNRVTLTDCTLSGNMADLDRNDSTWSVILYQSMSGDSEPGKGEFTMSGGTLISENGGLFYTTNTQSAFTLDDVTIVAAEDCEYLLRATGNANARGWGKSGANGADCVFTALRQDMAGDVIWDSISNLELTLGKGTCFTGRVIDDETCAGDGGTGSCKIVIDEDSAWIVSGDSRVTTLQNAGTIADAEGKMPRIIGADGTVYVEGNSAFTVTVDEYI